jgi:hypothetical protein
VLDQLTTDMVVGGRTLRVLNEDARATHLALHAAQNGPADTKAVADLERGLTQLTPARWREAARIARELGAEQAFSAGLRVTEAGRAITSTLGLRPPRDVTLLLRAQSAPAEALQIQQFVELGSMRRRAHLVARKLWPTTAYMLRRVPEARGGSSALLLARIRRLVELPHKFSVAFRSWSKVRNTGGASASSTSWATQRRRRTSSPVRPWTLLTLRLRGSRSHNSFILVAGPHGAGKSTVIEAFARRAAADGLIVHRAHHRPGLIAGRRDTGPVTDPHRTPPRAVPGALVKLLVVFADYLVGDALRWRVQRRTGLLILERGWFDMLADTRRYRVPEVLTPLVRLLGRLISRPDVLLLLTGDPDAIHARKPEIGPAEVARQQASWRVLAPLAAHRVLEMDSVREPPEHTAEALAEAIRTPGQWRRVPCTPSRVDLLMAGNARAGLAIYQPQSPWARIGTRTSWGLGLLGAAVDDPIDELADLWAVLGLLPTGVAAMRSSNPGRLVLGACRNGRLQNVIKIGESGDTPLRHEARMLLTPLAADLRVSRPELTWSGEWRDRYVLVTRAVERETLARWTIEEILPIAAGMAHAGAEGQSLTHGDLAPWNLLRTAGGPVLLDWEFSRWSDEPLHDLAHFVMQSGALRGEYSPGRGVELLCAADSPGVRLLQALGVDGSLARPLLVEYLEQARPTDLRAVRFRAEMLRLVSR